MIKVSKGFDWKLIYSEKWNEGKEKKKKTNKNKVEKKKNCLI